MILSRLGPLTRLTASVAKNLKQESNSVNFKQAVRAESQFQYRNPIPCQDYVEKSKGRFVFVSAVIWWWVLWRFAVEYEAFFGPFHPKMRDWTDEELGIPPLEEP